MAEWSIPKKARKSNFSTDEVDVLVDSVQAHYSVLYGKYAKRATNRWIRQKAWLDILRKVNGVSIEKRTLQEVKNKWKKCQYALKEKVSMGVLADEPEDSSWEDFMDSMPLQERLSKVAAQEKMAAGAAGPLKSQPLSPTKLKVTRQGPKMAPRHVEHPPSPVNEEMCLRWNSHHSNMQTAFPNILSKEQYVDVTLAAEGKTLKCHRLILSSCSPYFEEILSGISPFQHPVLFMRDIPFWILKSLCDFMYAGEVHIFQNKLEELLVVAEALKIKGLAGKSTPPEDQHKNDSSNANKERKKYQEKEKVPHQPPPVKKNPVFSKINSLESTSHDYDDDTLDPLELLEPLYEEVAEEKKPQPSTFVKPKENKYQYQPVKKPFTRRLRKRKFSGPPREPVSKSPPPVFSFRKGTRSRPNVKIPKYYHTDFANTPKPSTNSQTDPLLEVDEIKTEPIDVEDNQIDYVEDHYPLEEPANCDSPIIITSAPPSTPPNVDKFKKIKLTKPIITEVHSIEEKTTSGGLEVIKITLQPPVTTNQEKEGGPPNEGERDEENNVESPQIPNKPAEGENNQNPPEIEPNRLPSEGAAEAENEETEPNIVVTENEVIEQETAANGEGNLPLHEIRIEDVRSTCQEEEEEKTTSLDHLEKEAMNVANALNNAVNEEEPIGATNTIIEEPMGVASGINEDEAIGVANAINEDDAMGVANANNEDEAMGVANDISEDEAMGVANAINEDEAIGVVNVINEDEAMGVANAINEDEAVGVVNVVNEDEAMGVANVIDEDDAMDVANTNSEEPMGLANVVNDDDAIGVANTISEESMGVVHEDGTMSIVNDISITMDTVATPPDIN